MEAVIAANGGYVDIRIDISTICKTLLNMFFFLKQSQKQSIGKNVNLDSPLSQKLVGVRSTLTKIIFYNNLRRSKNFKKFLLWRKFFYLFTS